MHLHSKSPSYNELWSIYEGLLWAHNIHMTHIMMYSDCKNAIHLIEQNSFDDMGMYTTSVKS